MNELKNLSNLRKLLEEESVAAQFVVHLLAEIDNALRMSIRQLSSVLVLKQVNNLVQIHLCFVLFDAFFFPSNSV